MAQVTQDKELVEWYREIREEGHPDAKDVNGDCWIELKDISSLVQILATMAWIGCVLQKQLQPAEDHNSKATLLALSRWHTTGQCRGCRPLPCLLVVIASQQALISSRLSLAIFVGV